MSAFAPPRERLRVLIADDHLLFAESLMQLLSIDGRIEVIGIANDGVQAVSLAKELEPDVILMDVKMPVCDGIEAIGRLRDAGVRVPVMILTGANDSVDAEEALRAGASAFFRKEEGIDELRKVFFEVASLTAVLGHSVPA
ncbi:MAG: response regulator transcription factor [Gaiellaceae bacterium]